MTQTGIKKKSQPEPWSTQAVVMARDLRETRGAMKQIKQEIRVERGRLAEQQRLLEQITSLLNAMLNDNANGMSFIANEVHTFFEAIINRNSSLWKDLPEESMNAFRSTLLLRIRRTQAQLRQIRTSILHMPSADKEEPENLDVNHLIQEILAGIAANDHKDVAVKPSLDHRIKKQKYPPNACREALRSMIAWRYGLVCSKKDEARFHVRSVKLRQYIEISVWDNGGGLTDDQLHSLYNPLSAVKGKRLGLAWAVHCLEVILGGHIFFHPESGLLSNSRMIILLPITCD